ncbi:thrombospondin-type laminin G domain and EAR repeat-containing protein [Chanos chanos]|uniref:Thrombospondin-type laminin G domain and EAR repeat-containing protein n=1 Tax=Chanos chanos TaxID=29144 RepID=A0A6J2W3R0_CHACN|nr:thrombospondin-type laminin G domain and EAR repeat-containing protein-like [Chanos chanos]
MTISLILLKWVILCCFILCSVGSFHISFEVKGLSTDTQVKWENLHFTLNMCLVHSSITNHTFLNTSRNILVVVRNCAISDAPLPLSTQFCLCLPTCHIGESERRKKHQDKQGDRSLLAEYQLQDKVLPWSPRWLLLGLLLFPLAKDGKAVPWKPCTDLLPLDLLSRVLPQSGEAVSGVRMVQEGGVRGVQFSSPSEALSFPSSQLFINCHFFPQEFSIIVTLKVARIAQKRSEYIFSVVEEEQDQLLLGLRYSADRVHFLYKGPTGRERLTFRGIRLADSQWHSLVLAVSGRHTTLTVDCGLPLELVHERSFPSDFNAEGSRFFIGSCKRWKGLFSGLLRQLVLLPGSDGTSQVCPSSKPRLAEISVPPVLSDLPVKPSGNEVLMPPYEAEVRVTMGSSPPCTSTEQGHLWFNTLKKGLFLCDGADWLPMLQEKERLDYVDDYQDLYTSSETLDIELFQIPSVGLFAAMAHRGAKPGSAIYQWKAGKFELYQNISTFKAQAWKHFNVGKKTFLAVSNSGGSVEGEKELSVIYEWSSKRLRFVRYQTLETYSARDWEAFCIHDDVFLAVANHRTGHGNHNIDSVIYRWNPGTKAFEVNQTISTSGAYDWEFFTVGPYHFLVVANAFDGSSTRIDSSIYIWLGGAFQLFQTIRTYGATDWEMFQIGNRVFLAVANGHMLYERGPSLYAINSTIYELDMTTKMFLKFQDLVTYSAVDWEFFTLGDEHFLVVANSYDGASYSLNSIIYRWQGYEGFVPIHRLPTIGCSDWEFFKSAEGAYLMYSSAKVPLSKVFKLRTH